MTGRRGVNNAGWCVICHEPLIESGQCYCPKCREQGRRADAEALRRVAETDTRESSVVARIAAKVINDFMKEYEYHLQALMRDPFSKERQDMVRADERYIRSFDFAILTMNTVDPEEVIRYKHKECMDGRVRQ